MQGQVPENEEQQQRKDLLLQEEDDDSQQEDHHPSDGMHAVEENKPHTFSTTIFSFHCNYQHNMPPTFYANPFWCGRPPNNPLGSFIWADMDDHHI